MPLGALCKTANTNHKKTHLFDGTDFWPEFHLETDEELPLRAIMGPFSEKKKKQTTPITTPLDGGDPFVILHGNPPKHLQKPSK